MKIKKCLTLLLLLMTSATVWGTTYKLQQVTTVEAGSMYVFEQDGHVMNNKISSSALQTTNSYKTTGLNGEESYVWVLESGGTNTYYMKNPSIISTKYLHNSSSTSLSFIEKKTSTSKWAFNPQNDGTVLIQNTSNENRFLGYTTSTSYAYKAYAESNSNTYAHAIKVYKLVEENSNFAITAISNNDSFGTVSLSGNTITATPADGYQVSSSNPYTISPTGSATITDNGDNTFTVSGLTENCTITINFEVIPVVTHLYIKADTAPYVYTWSGSGDSAIKYTGNWPGRLATQDSQPTETHGVTWYVMDVPSSGFNLILNDGHGNQTEDILNIAEDTYFVWNSSADGKTVNEYLAVDFATVTASDVTVSEGKTTSSSINTSPEGLILNYSSDDMTIATVASDGTITGVAVGTTSVTVSWNTQEVGGQGYLGGSTTFSVSVTEEQKERTYVKVTSTEEIENGKKYLIVYETDGKAFDGSLEALDVVNNNSDVVISNNTITTDKNIYFIIDGRNIRNASGKYIGHNQNQNGLDVSDNALSNTISIDGDGNASIQATSKYYLRFNKSSGQKRFRYYGSGQQAIQLYKEVDPEVKIYVKSDYPPYVYTWTGDKKHTGEWPGTAAAATDKVTENGTEWWTMTIPAKGFNLILHNNLGGDNNQTENITNITEDTYFVWNSSEDGYAANQYLAVNFASVSASDITVREGNTISSPVVATPTGLSLTYSSSDDEIASVDAEGTVTGLTTGNSTITATWATQIVDGQGYLGGSVSYIATVKEAAASDVFLKATSVGDLKDGNEVIIVNDEYSNVMGEQRESNFGVSTLTIDKTTTPFEATLDDESVATVLTLEQIGDYWYFKDENGNYLYTASNSSNDLKTKNNADDFAKAAITINGDNSDAVIAFQGGNDRNVIRYNGSETGNGLFSCYAPNNTQKPVQIYFRDAQNVVVRPTIAPASGTYTEAQTVTITNNAEGATVYYTSDGTTPTTSSKVYSAPFVLNNKGTHTIKAIAVVDGRKSSVATSTIIIDINVADPVITPADGTQITEETQITISAGDGLVIYYTTDGSEPLVDGALTGTAKAYSGYFTLTKAGTVKAVSKDANGNFSSIVSATYSYNGTATLPYYERFDAGLGNFISVNTGEVEWKYREHNSEEFINKYGEVRKYAYCSNGSNKQNAAGKARFISPIIDLTEEGLSNVILNFIHAGNYFSGDDVLKNTCKVQIITNENERDISDVNVLSVDDNWAGIEVPSDGWFNYSDGLFTRKNSGDISLNNYIGKKVRICFLFDASVTTNFGNWNVDQISIRGELVEKVIIAQPDGATGEGYASYVVKNDIDAESTLSEKSVKLYKVVEFDRNDVVLVQLGLGTGNEGENTYSEKVVQAGSPVLVKASFGKKELVLVNSQEVIPKLRGNLLRSAVEGVTATTGDRFFVLQRPKSLGYYGFFLLGQGRNFEGRKAYLNGVDEVAELTTQTNARQGIFYFGEEDIVSLPTSIESVDSSGHQGVVYDLMGRKVADGMKDIHLPKGIYVVNGKKIVVK